MFARAPPLIWTDFSLPSTERVGGSKSITAFRVERLGVSRTHHNA
jgi:hypothetical protein